MVVFYELLMGLVELLLATSLIVFGPRMYALYQTVRANELIEDPQDLLIHVTQRLVPIMIEYRWYVASLLGALGTVKTLGAIGTLKGKSWGLSALIAIVLALLPFEAYDVFSQPSATRMVVLAINLLAGVYLLVYRRRRKLYGPLDA